MPDHELPIHALELTSRRDYLNLIQKEMNSIVAMLRKRKGGLGGEGGERGSVIMP